MAKNYNFDALKSLHHLVLFQYLRLISKVFFKPFLFIRHQNVNLTSLKLGAYSRVGAYSRGPYVIAEIYKLFV